MKYLYIIAICSTLWACGGSSNQFQEEEQETPTETIEAKTPVNTSDTILVQALGANMAKMRFDIATLAVPANKQITIALENVGTDPTMPHNMVIVEQGTGADVGQDGLKFKDNSYVNPEDKRVIAYSALAPMGETVYFTFTTPAAGEYEFICSYPGHWGRMKGKFVTE